MKRVHVPRVEIHALSYGKDAVGRLEDGRAAFIAGGAPGDVVEATIVEDHGRFVRMKIDELITPSPLRVDPPCPYHAVCGGCPWQHVSYSTQLEWKRRSVVDAFTRIGKIADAETIVAPCTPSPDEWGYRNKVEFEVTRIAGRLTLGLHGPGSNAIVPIGACLLLPKRLVNAPKSLQGALRFSEGSENLGILRVGLRAGANSRDLEIALWTEPGAFPRKPVAKTMTDAMKPTSLVRVLLKGTPKKRSVGGVEVLAGKGFWRERLAGHSFSISAPSFFQVNTKAAEAMVAHVIEKLDPDGSDRVLDLYSGAGTFTLPLAELAGDVVAVESYGSSVRDLRRNLEMSELWAEVVGGDAARELPGLGSVDLVVVDPPRAGLGADVVKALGATGARKIAYVSCDPATLARDLPGLLEAGYELESVTPFDLFPQSYHVETVVVMSRL